MPTVGEALEQARTLRAANNLAEAEVVYRQLVNLLPQAAELWGELGIFYLGANRPDAAVEPLRQATELDASIGAFHGALGAAYRLLKRRDEAVASFQRALDIGPPGPELLNNLGLALKDAGRKDEALDVFDRALRMRPDFQNGHFNRGNLLFAMGRLSEALASYQTAIQARPDDAAAHCGLGATYCNLGQFDAAMDAFGAALRHRPDYPEAVRNQALVWFLRGEYDKAWPAFESRTQCEDLFLERHFDEPRWDGSPLADRTLLVVAEQGLGDTLQFIRYLPLASQVAQRVWMEAQEVLRPLLVQSGYGDFLLSAGEVPKLDVQAPLLSLAGYLPDGSGQPYWSGAYLQADPRLVEQWRKRLSDVAGFKVGIAWAGNPEHSQDQFRSAALQELLPLARVPGVRLISLQKGAARDQLASAPAEMDVLGLGPELDAGAGAFMDTAAVMKNLDLVIAVDTSVAHLAGGLGAPVWLALQFAPDWRWQARGDTTPWYPSMRLFRQQAIGDWRPVFAEMAAELEKMVRKS